MTHSHEEPTTTLPAREQLKAELWKAMKALDNIAVPTLSTKVVAIDEA